MTTALLTCTPGFEQMLADELALFAMNAEQSGPGWALANRPVPEFKTLFTEREFCPHLHS